MIAPDITREQLIADERAAERAVVEAEARAALVVAIGTADEQATARAEVDAARAASFAARQRMQDGLAAWGRYAAYQEAVLQAAANGVTL